MRCGPRTLASPLFRCFEKTGAFFGSLLLAGFTTVPASAQPSSRGFVSIGGGYQGTATEFDDSFSFARDQETGTTRLTYPIDAGAALDIGGGFRIWRRLGAGVAVSRFSRDGVVRSSSSIPHPLFLQHHREVVGDGEGISHEETGIHLQALYLLPPIDRLLVTLMGGASILQVNHAMVLDVNYSEEYPYDTATFTGVDTSPKKGSGGGFNVGADLRWMFTRHVGVGMLLRFTRATVDLDAAPDRAVSIKAGGGHVGVGLRVAF